MISIRELLVILVIVILLFGTKKLRNVGADLGESIKNFRNSLKEGAKDAEKDNEDTTKIADNDSNKTKDNI